MDMIAKTLLHKLLLKVAKNYKVFSVKKYATTQFSTFSRYVEKSKIVRSHIFTRN